MRPARRGLPIPSIPLPVPPVPLRSLSVPPVPLSVSLVVSLSASLLLGPPATAHAAAPAAVPVAVPTAVPVAVPAAKPSASAEPSPDPSASPRPSAGPASAAKAGRSPSGPWPAALRGRARVVKERWFGLRMVDLTVSSPAVNARLPVRVLVPSGWSKQADRTWPVLYLLHGGADDYTSWTRMTDIEELTEGLDAIVVMPEAGRAGNYSDWHNGGKGGPPGWETFHTGELRRLLESGYRAGTRRAVAGLSMGAYGAMKYAARHPGMFRFVGAYSGVMSTRLPGIPDLIMNAQAAEGADPRALWGDPVRNRNVWKANDPAHLARNLRGTGIYISSGTTSLPGELDAPGTLWSPAHLSEPVSAYTTKDLVARLRRYGIKPVVHLYKDGTHSWPYWEREFTRSYPMILTALGLSRGEEPSPPDGSGPPSLLTDP
ncbi:esterase-like protein [Planomonospora sphaerica]|uniref:Esterase-like protein n=1 Tax=Planomonospora sphaerica TaxID=161355 RepID=A0A161LPQ3_9ACTN|nr:alpha/beta hydrolase family protein [Planomonospora sphaerica]GAT70155.1 esterase-like protein [Planomonospora sphaerica]